MTDRRKSGPIFKHAVFDIATVFNESVFIFIPISSWGYRDVSVVAIFSYRLI
jgi:hypothetical protein